MNRPDTIYVPVKASERLPEKTGTYFVIFQDEFLSTATYPSEFTYVTTWMEEIPSNTF
jgi:hypothetical protein